LTAVIVSIFLSSSLVRSTRQRRAPPQRCDKLDPGHQIVIKNNTEVCPRPPPVGCEVIPARIKHLYSRRIPDVADEGLTIETSPQAINAQEETDEP
jgi:hypothetical protein